MRRALYTRWSSIWCYLGDATSGMNSPFAPAWRSRLLVIVVLAILLTTPQMAVHAQTGTPGPILGGGGDASCTEGRLQVLDLDRADESLVGGVEAATEKAQHWQPDARLVELRLACPLLESGLLWHGEFYSDSAQSFINTDTGEIVPAEVEPDAIPTLVVDRISFQLVYRSLQRAGYGDELEVMPGSGVTVRTSTEETPFGPPSAPRGRVYFYVALLERGQVKDIWINADDGTIYRYDG